MAYLFPGIHPDGIAEGQNRWPRTIRRFVTEAWRRAESGEFADDELYPCDAQWCGLYDRMTTHSADETTRRHTLAAAHGSSLCCWKNPGDRAGNN
jgi:hypothetical protein